jgi:hypothetical protein
MHADVGTSIEGYLIGAGTKAVGKAASKWGLRRWFRYRAKRLLRKAGKPKAGFGALTVSHGYGTSLGTPGFTSPWWWGHYLDQQASLNNTASASYGTRGYAGYGAVHWPWQKDEEIAAAKALEEAECSGINALWPTCIVRRTQTQAQEAGERVGKAVYAQLWDTAKIPLLIGGVGLVAYLAVSKIQKARRVRAVG